METLWQDIRFGLRTMVRNPGFTAVVVLILALGIGATSSIVSVMSAVLFRAVPYEEPQRLVLLNSARHHEGTVQAMPISYLDFRDWRERNDAFEAMALYSNPQSFNLLLGGEARHVRGELVSSDYFPLLGVEPAQGRSFSADEDQTPGAPRIVVLSHELWRSLFGEEATLDGRRRDVVLNGESYEVVGVMPAAFQGMSDNAELWMPLTMASVVMGPPFLAVRPFRWLLGAGRLAPGISVGEARAAMDTVTSALAEEYPETNREVRALVTPLLEAWFGDLSKALWILLGAAALVLLIACNNVANMLLSRALARQREMALRAAVGATRARLVRQLLTESALLALLAGVLGLLLASRLTATLVAASAMELKSFVDISIDPGVVAVVLAVSLAAGFGFGLVPALMVSRTSLQEHLKEGSKGSAEGVGRRRFQSFLVVAEIALALVLAIGSGLMVRGFQRLSNADLGFRPESLETLRLYLKDPQYQDEEVVRTFSRQLLERLEAVPGAASATLAGPSIPTDDAYGGNYLLEGKDPQDDRNRLLLVIHHVSPGYFANLGIPVIEGRGFTLEDHGESLPVVVVSKTLAQRSWPGESAVGKGLRSFRSPPEAPWMRVIGVVDDVEHVGLIPDPNQPPDIYFPLFQTPPRVAPILNVLVRAAEGIAPASLISPLRQAAREVAPHLPVYDVQTMEQRLEAQVGRERFLVLVMSLFTVLALLLASLGIYGLLSFAVAQRTREIGIRMALGADRGTVLKLVVKRAAILALFGLGIGLAVALVLSVTLSRVLENLLHGMSSPRDPLTFVGMAALLLVVALVASFLPARRATRINPMDALRIE